MSTDSNTILADLAEERLHLEREKLEIERGRLEAARAAMQHGTVFEHAPARAWLIAGGIIILTLVSFACGALFGSVVSRSQDDASRERRIAQTLSHLESLTGSSTNGIAGGRRDVSILVVQ